MSEYRIIVYSSIANSQVVGSASNENNDNLYVVIRDPEDNTLLKYIQLTAIDGTDQSLVTNVRDGLMHKEDKVLFDQLMSYIDMKEGSVRISNGASSILVSNDAVDIGNGSSKLKTDSKSSQMSYEDENNYRKLITDEKSMRYEYSIQDDGQSNLHKEVTWEDFRVITSPLTHDGVILSPKNLGEVITVRATNMIEPINKGKAVLSVSINSRSTYNGKVIVLRDVVTGKSIASLTRIMAGYRKYEIPFTIPSDMEVFEMEINSYATNIIEYGDMSIIYARRKGSLESGERFRYLSDSGSSLEVLGGEMNFKNTQGDSTIYTDTISSLSQLIGDEIIVQSSNKGAGHYAKSDLTMQETDFKGPEMTLTWK